MWLKAESLFHLLVREMGGLLSPALLKTMTTETEECDAGGVVRPEELELMYDPQLNCFYDPITCKYYELIHTDHNTDYR